MKKLRIKLLLAIMPLLSSGVYCQDMQDAPKNQILTSDLVLLIGHWEGTLTYVDYSTNEPYTMPANLVMKQGKNEFQLIGSHEYPNEPGANTNVKLKISENGARLNKRNVTSREILPDGQIQIMTEYLHKDGNDGKMATNRITYTLGSDKYSVRKDVRFDGTTDWIMRNEYSYQKK